jgi:hypothetical protein
MKKHLCRLLITVLFIVMCLPKVLQAQRPELIIPATHSAFSAVISPDEKWLASAGAGGIKIWDNKTNRLIKNLAPGSKDNNRFDGGRINMAIDNASNVLAMQVVDTIYFFDFDKFTITGKIKVNGKRTAFVFADNKTLYAAGYYEGDEDNYVIEKINIDNAAAATLLLKCEVKTMATHNINKLSISANGNELLIYDAVIGSWLADITSNKIKRQFKTEQNFAPYSYLPNGNYLALSGKKEKQLVMAELDSKTYLPLKKSKTIFKDDPDICAMEYTLVCPSASGKIILYYQNDFGVFNSADFSVSSKKQFPHVRLGMNNSMNIVMAPSGNYYVQSLNMTKNNISNNAVLSTIGEFPLDTYVQFVYKNIDGVCLKDRILTFDNGVFNQRMVEPVVKDESGFIYRITNDGKTGFIYNQYWGLYRFDPTKAKIEYESIAKINNMNKKFVGMQIFEAANLLALIGNEGIYVMDLKTLKVLYIVDIPYGLHYTFFERLNKYCDISPDNSKMILFAEAREDESNFIYCVDLADRNEKWKYESKNIENIRFTKNGKNISFTTGDKLVYLDAETGKQLGGVVQLPQSDYETIISQSGNIAATKIPIDTNIRAGFNVGLIDIVTNKPAGTLQGTGDEVWGFVFLRNERYMLTEEYGGLCLWDVTRQRKIGKLYMFENSADWVLLAADGRFDATEGALKKMYFTKGKEIIPLESLYEKYYVPGLLKQVWENGTVNNVPDINDLKLPPTVKISLQIQERNLEVAEDNITTIKVNKESVAIKAEADGLKDVVSEIRLYQNGKLVHTTRNLTVEDDNKGYKTMTKTFLVTLNAGDNNFKAIAINSQRTESMPALLGANYTPVNVPAKPEVNSIQLHLFVVGVNNYKNPKYNLNYAQADAAAFTEAITNGSHGLFAKVNTTILKDEEATREGITAAFEKIKAAANPQDLFVFYYAGHGVVNDKKEFFLVPYDVTQLYGNDGALAQKGFSAGALQQMSKDIKAQKQLFILDACQSAGALEVVAGARGAAEEKAIAQLARSTGTQWLTASGSEQFASEFSQLGHGSFTYCLLEAFKGDASPTDKKLTVKQLDAYLQTKVPEVTQKYKGTPQYPASYSYGNDFPIIIIK